MKTKSFLLALSAVALGFLFSPSEAQAGGRRDCGYNYNYYRGNCYRPVVVRPVRVVRPCRVYRPAVCFRAPAIRVSIGFGGGGYYGY